MCKCGYVCVMASMHVEIGGLCGVGYLIFMWVLGLNSGHSCVLQAIYSPGHPARSMSCLCMRLLLVGEINLHL